MTFAAQPNIEQSDDWGEPLEVAPSQPVSEPEAEPIPSLTMEESWQDLRNDADIQFEQIEVPVVPPREPSAFERWLQSVFEWLADLFSPIGTLIANSWWFLQYALLALLIGFILYLIVRMYGPLGRQDKGEVADEVPEWRPDRQESLALLEDADRLAAEGKFDEATHLLLKRSVGQIARARPDWVEPSSTARELAALKSLPDAARSAFGTIAERVERSLFALRSLDRVDWETARAAYAEFALAKIEGRMIQKVRA
ncbi:MAG: hypothetical protein AAGL10_08440 [Pseudomonadota bacterium]